MANELMLLIFLWMLNGFLFFKIIILLVESNIQKFMCDNCECIYGSMDKLFKIEKNTYICGKCYKEQ